MVQNHMLQLLALVAMEPPTDFDATAVRDEKVKVLRSLRPIGAADADAIPSPANMRAAPSTASRCPAMPRKLAATAQPRPSSPSRRTSTIGAGTACRSICAQASACPQRETEIFIQFKAVPHSIFASRGAATRPNKLIIGLQPEETIRLTLMAKAPGLDRQGVRLREIPLDIGLANAFSEYRRRIAYERLLLDLIEGDPTLFVRRDEVEAQWAWIDHIRAGWAETGHDAQALCGGNLGAVRCDRARPNVTAQLARLDRRMPLNQTIERYRPHHRAVEPRPAATSS